MKPREPAIDLDRDAARAAASVCKKCARSNFLMLSVTYRKGGEIMRPNHSSYCESATRSQCRFAAVRALKKSTHALHSSIYSDTERKCYASDDHQADVRPRL